MGNGLGLADLQAHSSIERWRPIRSREPKTGMPQYRQSERLEWIASPYEDPAMAGASSVP